MARGSTLVRLLTLYRAECRMSVNPAHHAQARDTQVNHIQRTQEWLYDDHEWPLLRVERTFDLQAGQRYYDPPEDIDIDRIQRVEVRHDQMLNLLTPGIEPCHYAAYDSDLDEQSWPPSRWMIRENSQIEIWPVPNANVDAGTRDGQVRVTGIKKLSKLVDDSDTADLDDRLIILFCAAEYLAGTGAKDAQFKLQQAQQRLAKLRGAQMQPRKISLFGTRSSESRTTRVPIAVYNKPS